MEQAYFISNNTNPLNCLHNALQQTFLNITWKHTTSKETEVIIKSLKMKNSNGYDEISTKILKSSTPYILSPLTYICNKVLSTGVFPDRQKYLEIKPLFMKGDKTSI